MPAMGDSSPREVPDSSLVRILPSAAQESCGKPPPLPSQDPCPSGMDTPSPDPQGMSFRSSRLLPGKERVTEEPPGGWEGREAGCSTGQASCPAAGGLTPTQGQAATSKPLQAPKQGQAHPEAATQQLPTLRTGALLTHTQGRWQNSPLSRVIR